MISVIICSRDAERMRVVSNNIAETIGTPFEIIGIDNASASMGICTAYNTGIDKANYDFLCFVHEDVFFETQDWGKRVMVHFADPKTGMIGVAGGDTKASVPSSWSPLIHGSEISIVQHTKTNTEPPRRISSSSFGIPPPIKCRVSCIDGVFMCVRKSVMQTCRFDTVTLPGFHGYDIDFSLQVNYAGYEVYVVFDIILHHFSEGSFDRDWLISAEAISGKWRWKLPFSVKELSHQDFIHQHWTAMRNLLQRLFDMKLSNFEITRIFLRYSFTRHFHLFHFLHFVRIIGMKWTGMLKAGYTLP